MDVDGLARELHRRRTFSVPSASAAQAAAEALVCVAYEFTPTLDDFCSIDMSLVLRDESGRKVGVVASEGDPFRVSSDRVEFFDALVFVVGSSISVENVEIMGWLPDTLLLQAPRVDLTTSTYEYEVSTRFLFELPLDCDFVAPDLDAVPKVWSYEHGGWWTPYGCYVFDSAAAERIRVLDQELAR